MISGEFLRSGIGKFYLVGGAAGKSMRGGSHDYLGGTAGRMK
jgi:hypothetical protein